MQGSCKPGPREPRTGVRKPISLESIRYKRCFENGAVLSPGIGVGKRCNQRQQSDGPCTVGQSPGSGKTPHHQPGTVMAKRSRRGTRMNTDKSTGRSSAQSCSACVIALEVLIKSTPVQDCCATNRLGVLSH